MKPKGGAKCSRRFHSLWLKCLESRKRVRLGRKRFWSHGDLEALTFTESGHAYVQEGTEVGQRAPEGQGHRLRAWQALSPSSLIPQPHCLGPLWSQGSRGTGTSGQIHLCVRDAQGQMPNVPWSQGPSGLRLERKGVRGRLRVGVTVPSSWSGLEKSEGRP